MSQTFSLKKPMPPPWLMYPKIERASIGWRMGYGESYLMVFHAFLESLTKEEQKRYQQLFPAPKSWGGYWTEDLENEEWEDEGDDHLCFQNQHHFVQYWSAHGLPQYSLARLQQDYQAGKKLKFLFFWGHQPSANGSITQSCLSQWWKADFHRNTQSYCCVEQYMMAEKARLFGDNASLEKILNCTNPGKIKDLGRRVQGFSEADWNAVKYQVVLTGNYHKFLQNPDLLCYLLNTGDQVLVEASPYDGIWGIRMGANRENVENPLCWKGENLLGFALMEVRDELRRVTENSRLVDFDEVRTRFQ